jgi:hypothetical protein
MAAAFDEATRELLDGRNFATVATLNPDGGPQTSVVWIVREGVGRVPAPVAPAVAAPGVLS